MSVNFLIIIYLITSIDVISNKLCNCDGVYIFYSAIFYNIIYYLSDHVKIFIK